MDVVITNGDCFKKIVTCLKDLIKDSVEFSIKEEGFFLQTRDTGKIVFISLMLSNDCFSKYNIEEEFKLPINLSDLNDALKLGKAGDSIALIYKKNTDKLNIKFGNKKTQFNMKLPSTEDFVELEDRDIDYDIKVYTSSGEFQKSIKELSCFGDTCNIKINSEELTITVDGNSGTGEISIDNVEIKFKESEEEQEDQTYSADINISMLNIFSKAGLSNETVLKFKKNSPFCFEYDLDCDSYVKFYIAEKVA